MQAVLGIVIMVSIIFVWEGRMLWKQRRKRELAVFSFTLLLAGTLYVGIALHLPVPSPTEIIGKVLEPIVRPINQWIKGGAS